MPTANIQNQLSNGRLEYYPVGVTFNGEYLEFKSYQLFDSLYKQLSSEQYSNFINWKAAVSFQSYDNFYKKAIEEDEKYSKFLATNMTQELAVNIKRGKAPHSLFTLQNQSIFLFNDKGCLDANLHDYRLAYLVNKDGIVRVGKYLFQYTSEYIKVMPVKNKNKINLLRIATTNLPNQEIVVKQIHKLSQSPSTNGRIEASCIGNSQSWDSDYALHYQGYNYFTERRLNYTSNLFSSQYPIYEECRGKSCVETEPTIIGWETSQTLSVHLRQWEKTTVYLPFVPNVVWEGEARSNNLSISSSVTGFSGDVNSNNEAVANLYFNKGRNFCDNYFGTVYITGDTNVSKSFIINSL